MIKYRAVVPEIDDLSDEGLAKSEALTESEAGSLPA